MDDDASPHLQYLIGDKKNKFTMWVRDGDNIEKISEVKILYKDEIGYTIEAINYLGKNRRVFIPNRSVSKIRSEII